MRSYFEIVPLATINISCKDIKNIVKTSGLKFDQNMKLYERKEYKSEKKKLIAAIFENHFLKL